MNGQTVLGISSLIVALAALVFSIVSFRQQQERAERHARASVRPMLWIHSQGYIDLKSIQLSNHGLGPAIVRRVEFKKGTVSTNKMVELFNLTTDKPWAWEAFVNLTTGRAIPAESTIVLVKQSLEHLVSQGIDEQTALRLLQAWQEQKSGIMVRIEYDDIYGNRMEPVVDTLA